MEEGTNSRASVQPPYEVFLNFRGSDTRHGFTDFLYRGMVDAGILVFRDSESLHVGKRIGSELRQAIDQSKIYIPIFSKKYASSRWCLRELAYMVECTSKSKDNKEILPIFLDVEPDDVKLKTNLYRQVLSKHPEKFYTEVESWEKALIEVGEIKGWNWKKDESQVDLILSAIQTILAKLNVGFKKNVTEHLVGVDDRVEALIKMLDVESNSVQFLGIHGMGGIGKTTLAKVVFNQLFSHFQGCNFMSDVRESSQRHGLVYLQKQLLSKFLDSRSINQIHDVDDGVNMIKRVLCNKKVLIILDDVDEKEQLNNLAKKDTWFGSGSRIIITTRNKSILMIEEGATDEGPIKKFANVSTYEVPEMEFVHALKLFSRNAFRRDCPPENYVFLSENIVSTLGNLPLALEVTGSFLSGKSEAFWADTLKKLEKAPSMEVQKSLRITYERLDDAQRQVFLDIACFFVNKDKTYPFYMWDDCGYCPHNAIEVLYLMSLIKIKDDNTFWMHDQVRDLGREIVRQENSKDPCKRSRIWNHEEALRIMKWKEGSRKIEALSLGYRGDIVTNDEVANLQKLRFFEGNGVFLVGDFDNLLSSLTWLSWRWCPCEFVATNFHLTNIVVLDLSCSDISEEWVGWNQIRVARKLKILDLNNCNYLRRTPDLSSWMSLERLILEGCHNLIEIDPSIGKLKLLTTLNLNGCKSLGKLPEELGCLEALTEIFMPCWPYEFKLPETFGNLKSLLTFDVSHRQISMLPHSIGGLVKLRRLNLSHCMKINELPDSVGKLQSLVELDLSLTCLGHLPDSIGNLKQLTVLRMSRINGMKNLPSAIGLVEKLEELDASGCTNLTGEIPEEIGRLSCLRILDLSHTRISGLPDSIGNLKQLKVLRMRCISGIEKLPKAIGLLEKLEELDANGCYYLTGKIPEEIGRLSCLRILDLSYTDIFEIPTTVSRLSNLEILYLESCLELKQLPELPPSLTCLRWTHDTTSDFYKGLQCARGSVIASPTGISPPSQLEILTLSRKTMHFHPQFPSSLRDLDLGNLVIEQSSSFSNLKRLSTLQLDNCLVLGFSGVIHAEFKDLCRLKHLNMLDAPLQFKMERLTHLKMRRCKSLSKVFDLSPMKNLQEIHLLGCLWLVEISGLEELGSLSFLSVVNCSIMERMSDLAKLRKLRKLRVGVCPKLRSLEGLNHLESLQKMWIHDCSSLESLVDTSNLHLQCSTIECCEQLPNRDSYCRCHDDIFSMLTKQFHDLFF